MKLLNGVKGIFLFLFVFVIISTQAQIRPINDYRFRGSAKELKGKVYVLTVFVGTNYSSFPKSTKDSYYSSLYAAQDWIAEQAKSYGILVSFDGGMFGYENTIIVDDIPQGVNSGYNPFLDKVFQKIGYEDANGFCRWLSQNGYSNGCAMIVMNRDGQSFSYPYCLELEQYYGNPHLEASFISHDDTGYYLPATLAHEMLHLYGAWDLYADNEFANTVEQEELAERLFPNSIMLHVRYDLSSLVIDDLTAWLIGWTYVYKDWFSYFQCPNR